MPGSYKFAARRALSRTDCERRREESRWLKWARSVGDRHRSLRARRHALNLRLLRRLFRGGMPRYSRFFFSASHRHRLEFGVAFALQEASNIFYVHSAQRWNLMRKRNDLRRFFSRHTSIGLRIVRRLAGSTVHTAHRKIVRTIRPAEQRYVRVATSEPLARAMPAQARRTDPAFDIRTAAFAMQGRQLPPAASGALPISALDVNQIADQVMRQLDHRISAWRERRGRA